MIALWTSFFHAFINSRLPQKSQVVLFLEYKQLTFLRFRLAFLDISEKIHIINPDDEHKPKTKNVLRWAGSPQKETLIHHLQPADQFPELED